MNKTTKINGGKHMLSQFLSRNRALHSDQQALALKTGAEFPIACDVQIYFAHLQERLQSTPGVLLFLQTKMHPLQQQRLPVISSFQVWAGSSLQRRQR
jgi:malate synthase